METSEPEEQGKNKFEGILLFFQWVKIDIQKFKVLKTSALWVVGDTFPPNFGPKKVKNGILTHDSKNYLKRRFQNTP